MNPPVLPLCSAVGLPMEWLKCQVRPAANVVCIVFRPYPPFFSMNAGASNAPFTIGIASTCSQSSRIVV